MDFCFLAREALPMVSHLSGRLYPKQRAFTLVELLVVIAIVGILVALLLPAVQAAREAARRTQCVNNLKQLALGMQNYESANRHYPAAYITTDPKTNGSSYGISYGDDNHNGPPGWAWCTLLLPYIEESALHDGLKLNLPCWAPENAALVKTRLPAVLCPSAAGGGDGFAVERDSGDGRTGCQCHRNSISVIRTTS